MHRIPTRIRQQAGFTLIELVMVIVILGILAVVAIPQFVDLRGDAQQGTTEGVAGALGSASAINYAACQITGSAACNNTIGTCADVAKLLQGGALPAGGYSLDTTALTTTGVSCTLTGPGSKTATFTGHKTTP